MDELYNKIEKRAYEIYIRRTQSELWDYGRMGTAEGDWKQAEKEVMLELRSITPTIVNRIQKYG